MTWLLFIALLMLPQASAPLPRKAIDDSAKSANTVEKESKDDKCDTAPALIQNKEHSASTQGASDNHAAEEKPRHIVVDTTPGKDGWDKAYICLTAALVLIGALTLGAIGYQAREMARATSEMRESTKLVKRQADLMERQTKATEDAAEAALDNARAAETMAQIAAATELPRLMLNGIAIADTGSSDMRAIIQFPNVRITVKNFGKSPAFLVSESVEFLYGDLPSEPVYNHPTNWPPEAVVEPGATRLTGQFRPDNLASLDDIEAVVEGKKILWVYGYVFYRDYLGNHHRLRFGKYIEVRPNCICLFWEGASNKYTECD